jgi:hypothetical protein
MNPTVTVDQFVVIITGIPPGAVIGWGDCRSSTAGIDGVAIHDYDAPSSTDDRLYPHTTMPGRRGLVINMPDSSDRWSGHVDVACVQDAW